MTTGAIPRIQGRSPHPIAGASTKLKSFFIHGSDYHGQMGGSS